MKKAKPSVPAEPAPSAWAAQLLDKLALLRKLKPEGAAIRFAKPISLAKLEAFEARYHVRLPEDYRDLLRYVGNGGGGPDYGLAPLRAWKIDALPRVSVTIRSTSGGLSTAGTAERQALPRAASLERPFLLERAWSVEEEDAPFSVDAADATDATPYDGCLELSDMGCGYFSFLVVNGPRRGEVWVDYSAAMQDGKLEPIASSFREWFEAQWLDSWLVSSLLGELQTALKTWALRKPGKKSKPGGGDSLRRQPEGCVPGMARNNSQPWMAKSRVNPKGCEQDASNKDGMGASRSGRDDAENNNQIDKKPRSRRHDDILRWQDCFVVRAEQPSTLIHRAWLELYLLRFEAFDALSAQASALGVADSLLEPLLRVRHRDDFALAEGRDAKGLRRAAAHPVAAVRRAVASNPICPPELLHMLATDSSDDVRRALALNPAAPLAVLLEVVDGVIGQWENEQSEELLLILDTAARRTPSPGLEGAALLLQRIAGLERGPLGPWAVRAALLSNALPARELEACASHGSPVIRHAVALCSSTPPKLVESLASDRDATVREAVASRLDLSAALLDTLGRDDSVQVRRAIAAHPQAPEQVLRRLCLDLRREHEVSYALAARPLPQALHELHALHPDYVAGQSLFGLWPYYGRRGLRALPLGASFAEVRELSIYSHPSYPEPLLAPHIPEQYNIGGYEMGLHPWLSTELMELLSRNEYAYCRGRVATRSDVPEDVLLRVVQDEEPIARELAAQNPRLPLALWHRLAEDVDDVQRGAASNPAAPVEGLVRLASSPNPWVRRALLLNPRTPQNAVEALSDAPEADVRKWAALAPALGSDALRRLLSDSNEAVRKAARWRQLRDRMLLSAALS